MWKLQAIKVVWVTTCQTNWLLQQYIWTWHYSLPNLPWVEQKHRIFMLLLVKRWLVIILTVLFAMWNIAMSRRFGILHAPVKMHHVGNLLHYYFLQGRNTKRRGAVDERRHCKTKALYFCSPGNSTFLITVSGSCFKYHMGHVIIFKCK